MNGQHTQPAGARRNPYGYADGGIVGGIRRLFTKTPAAAPAPAAPPATDPAAAAPAAPAPAGISAYAGMSATQRREKEAGLADGGLIRGPGTGTSDSISDEMPEGTFIMPTDSTEKLGLGASRGAAKVPVKVSAGEFELPPEQVQAVGAAVLGAIKSITHTPTGKQPIAADVEDVEDKLAPSFADGGIVDDETRKRLIGQIPTGGVRAPAAQPGNVLTDTELGRNISNTLSAVAPVGAGGATRALAGLGRAGSTAAASPAAVAAAPFVPPVLGGAALVGAASPAATAPTPATATAPTPAAVATPAIAPPAAAAPGTTVQPALGVIRREGNSYSGTDIGANATIDNPRNPGAGVTSMPAAAIMGGSPSQDMALAEARNAAASRGDFGAIRSSYAAQGQAFNGAEESGPTTDQLTRLASAPMGTPGKGAARRMLELRVKDATERRGQDQVNTVAQARLGIDRSTAEATQAEKQGLVNARAAYLNAKTPEEKAAAETTLRAFQGKYEKEIPDVFTTTPLPAGVDELGNKVPGGAIVTDRRSGATRIITGAETQGKPAAPTVGLVKNGYRFKGGNPADQKSWEKV